MCIETDATTDDQAKTMASQTQGGDTEFTVIWAAPILPGKSEAWRRFIQEMMGERRAEYEEVCSRLRIQAARAWITETAKGDVGVIAVIASQPHQIMSQLAASSFPFDRWLREQLAALQGLDISLPPAMSPSEMVLDWQSSAENVKLNQPYQDK